MSGSVGSRNSRSGIVGPVGFFAKNNASGSYSSSADVQFPNVDYGSEYFDGTVFIAPISGFYAISFSVKGQGTGDTVYCRGLKNGSAFGPALEFHNDINSAHTCMSFNYKLDPMDQIKLGLASNVKVDGSDHFAICLIG